MKRWMTTLLTTLLLAGTALPGHAAETALRIGFQKGGGLFALMKKQATLETALAPQGVTVSWIEFPAGPQMLEALYAGSIDIGTTGAPPPIFAQAAGVDLVYVGAEPGTIAGEAVIVPAGSSVRTVAQLKGKKVALQKGSGSHFLLVAALEKAGLAPGDITPVYLTPSDARAAFVSGAIDAWVIWDPYLAAAQETLGARVVADYTGLMEINGFYEASRAFTAKSPQLIAAVLAQLKQTGAWARSHPQEVAAMIAAQTGLPPKVVALWQRRIRFGTMPIDDVIIARQQQVADIFYRLKLIPRKIEIKEQNVWRWKP